MKKIKKLAPQPFSIDTEVFLDDRGSFVPFIDLAKHVDLAKKIGAIKRVYYVHNHAPHIVRGFHYHDHEWKIFTVAAGAAKFVAINPRNPGDRHIFVSSDRKNRTIVVPPGYANGWVSLAANTILVCASNSTTEESVGDDKRFDPMKWGDVWSIKGR